jgi:tRNA threonylcarbamoyladenosine biosynthesis protein TsaE
VDAPILEFETHSPEETIAVGLQLAQKLKPGDIVCLSGDLGAGKTHFTKGIAQSFGIPHDEVSSPTYSIIQVYGKNQLRVYHIDAYRLTSEQEALDIGLDEILSGKDIFVVEWPERIKDLIGSEYWSVKMKHIGNTLRHIQISHHQ